MDRSIGIPLSVGTASRTGAWQNASPWISRGGLTLNIDALSVWVADYKAIVIDDLAGERLIEFGCYALLIVVISAHWVLPGSMSRLRRPKWLAQDWPWSLVLWAACISLIGYALASGGLHGIKLVFENANITAWAGVAGTWAVGLLAGWLAYAAHNLRQTELRTLERKEHAEEAEKHLLWVQEMASCRLPAAYVVLEQEMLDKIKNRRDGDALEDFIDTCLDSLPVDARLPARYLKNGNMPTDLTALYLNYRRLQTVARRVKAHLHSKQKNSFDNAWTSFEVFKTWAGGLDSEVTSVLTGLASRSGSSGAQHDKSA